MSEENAETSEVVVTPETESAAENAADLTPEAEVETDTADAETAPAEADETTESDDSQTVEGEIPVATAESADVDALGELEPNKIPTPTDIDKLRIPKEVKADFKRVAEVAETATKQLEEIGGDFGVSVFAPIAKLYTQAAADENDLGAAVAKMMKANEVVTVQLLEGGTQFMLNNPAHATPMLQMAFGENATVETVKALLALDNAGYFEQLAGDEWRNDANEFLRGGLAGTDLYQKQATENQRLQNEVAQLRQAIQDPQKLQQLQQGNGNGNGERAVKAFESDFYAETPKVLQPFFDKVNWGDGAHAKLVTEYLQLLFKTDPNYQAAETYLRKNGVYQDGDSKDGMATANLTILKSKLQGKGLELVRELQRDLRNISENSRNAKIVKDKEVKATAKKEATSATLPTKYESHESRQARIDAEFKAKIKAAREAEVATV